MKHKESDLQQFSNFVIFHTADGKVNVDVLFKHDTVWLTQKLIAELFEKGRSTITEHLNQIFADGELDVNVVCRKFRHTTPHGAIEGKTQQSESKYYSLRAVVAVGYRVNSHRAIEFRKWATQILHEYIIKGFAMDDERLKNLGGGGYWKELLQRIRDIRASEKVFYRQVLDIYATSFDYDPRANVSIEFFQKVQNKIHYAVYGQTAAELIYDRVDAKKQFMSLQTFPGSRPYLKDAVVAKNYLNEKELRSLGQLVSGYLDFAERQAERKQPMTMQDWASHHTNWQCPGTD